MQWLDLQPSNILLGIDDGLLFETYEKDELEAPIPRKPLTDRTIYLSRRLPLTFGLPLLCDFSEARFGDEIHRDDIMPDVYRAPEVILGMQWSYSVDIWNVAMVVSLGQYPTNLFRLQRIPKADLTDLGPVRTRSPVRCTRFGRQIRPWPSSSRDDCPAWASTSRFSSPHRRQSSILGRKRLVVGQNHTGTNIRG